MRFFSPDGYVRTAMIAKLHGDRFIGNEVPGGGFGVWGRLEDVIEIQKRSVS